MFQLNALTDENINELSKAFLLIKGDYDNINSEQFVSVITSVDLNFSEDDMKDMIDEIDMLSKGTINFHDFLNIISRKLQYINTIGKLTEAFKFIDDDNDGRITSKQFESVMRNLGKNINEDELSEMIDKININDNGKIDLSEYLRIILQKMQDNQTEEEIYEAFTQFDEHGTGFISANKLREIMTNYSEKINNEEIDEMIREANVDNNGQINYNSFVKMMFPK